MMLFKIKIRPFLIISIPIFLFYFSACNTDDELVSPDLSENTDSIFNIDEFPLSVGNIWVYERSNNITNEIDTIELRVIDKIIVSNDSSVYKVHFTKENQVIDSSLYIKSDSFIFYSNLSSTPRQIIDFRLKFPLDSGDFWMGEDAIDTVKVNGKSHDFNFRGNIYGTIFLLKRDADYFPNEFRVNDIIISPNVGLISFDYQQFTSPIALNKTFHLLEFQQL